MEPRLSPPARQLCITGVALLVLGMLNGAVVPAFAVPRIGLAAHLAAMQSGMLLAILGLLWPHLALGRGGEAAARLLAIGSLYATWLGIALAGVFGATRVVPIAGAGVASQAAPWQEGLCGVLVIGGGIATFAAGLLVLRGIVRRAA